MTVIIQDNHVTCPHCDHNFEVRRKNGGGASYVKTWQQLPQKCMDILSVWLSQTNIRSIGFTKSTLRTKLAEHDLYIKEDPMNARISELLGLGLIQAIPQYKLSPHNTSKAPIYYLDIPKASKVMSAGGRLDA